jgi:hypothetical protein
MSRNFRLLAIALLSVSILPAFESNADSVKLKPGVNVELKSPNSVTVTMMRRPAISGEFDCSCSQGSNGGSCTVTISSGVIFCGKGANDTCNQSCELGTVISGNVGALIARGQRVKTRNQP